MKDMQENAGIKLFALNSNQELAEKIAEEMGVELCDASVKHFSDGEIQININESVRGDDVFIIQSISDPVNENFMELMVMMDALRRASAVRLMPLFRITAMLVPIAKQEAVNRLLPSSLPTLFPWRCRSSRDIGSSCRPIARVLQYSGRPSFSDLYASSLL